MSTLYLIRGIPGSGKSTIAAQLANSGIVAVSLEADQYFVNTAGIYNFNPNLLGAAHQWCQDEVKSWLMNGHSVAVSNTSTTEKEVTTYKKIAEEYNAAFVSLIVEHRHEGKNVHNVPVDSIARMKQRFSVKL